MSISSKVDGGGEGSEVIEGPASNSVPVEGKNKDIKYLQILVDCCHKPGERLRPWERMILSQLPLLQRS
jgi:hypothetical protein